MKRELDHLARFMHMAVDYAKKIGFTGQFYFEPKPKEPTKHQYDFDAAACINFLRAYGLADHVKLNIETNHATLAGHTRRARAGLRRPPGLLGLGRRQHGRPAAGLGHRPVPHRRLPDHEDACWSFLKYGGFTTGGLNFDAKVRRESFEPVDLFYAHIGGMDAFAKGLKIAAAIRADGELDEHGQASATARGTRASARRSRPASTTSPRWRSTCSPRATPRPTPAAGRSCLENIVNRYVF